MPCVVCGEVRIVQTHHFNGDRRDNSPGNLVRLCPTCHYLHHHGGQVLRRLPGGRWALGPAPAPDPMPLVVDLRPVKAGIQELYTVAHPLRALLEGEPDELPAWEAAALLPRLARLVALCPGPGWPPPPEGEDSRECAEPHIRGQTAKPVLHK